jgi:hypothetical protein
VSSTERDTDFRCCGVHSGSNAEALLQPVELEASSVPDAARGNNLAAALEALDALDLPRETKACAEAAIFRKALFGTAASVECAICGRELPIRLLVAAHIKKRSSCSDGERRSLHVVMPVCRMGCDELFERRFVYVDDTGRVKAAAPQHLLTADLAALLSELNGRECAAYSPATSAYFQWHREHPVLFSS